MPFLLLRDWAMDRRAKIQWLGGGQKHRRLGLQMNEKGLCNISHHFHKRFITFQLESRPDGTMEFVSVLAWWTLCWTCCGTRILCKFSEGSWLSIFKLTWQKQIFFFLKDMHVLLTFTRAPGPFTRSEQVPPRRKLLKEQATTAAKSAAKTTRRLVFFQGSLNYPLWGNHTMQMYINFEGFPLVMLVALDLKGYECVHQLVCSLAQNINPR